MLSFSEELLAVLSAPYPFVWLSTWEEERVLALLTELSDALDRPLEIWRPEDQRTDVAEALDQALRVLQAGDDAGIHVFLDVHPYLDDPARIRRLRVLERRLVKRGACMVFVSPVVVRPPELEKDWTVMEVPLPDRFELRVLLDRHLPEESFAALDRDRLVAAALGLTAREATRAYERSRHRARVARARRETFDWEGAVIAEKRRLLREGTAAEFWEARSTLRDVGGLDQLKSWVLERGRAFDDEARHFGLPVPRGLLLLGVQGCGKSLAAKAVAATWGLPLLRMDMGSLFLGSGAPDDVLRRILRTAEAMAPCVLWVDELEKGFGADGSAGADASTTRLLGSLLTWLQEKTAPVFFTATANRVQHLPPELLRRGRFDEVFFVDLPGPADRAEILTIQLRARDRDPALFDLPALVGLTEHFSGAELEQVVVGGLHAAFAARRDLTQGDMEQAARHLVPLYALYETDIKALRTWAEGRARNAARDRRLADLFTAHHGKEQA